MTRKDAAQTRAKLEKLAGWKPNMSFAKGLKRTVEWFSEKKQATNVA